MVWLKAKSRVGACVGLYCWILVLWPHCTFYLFVVFWRRAVTLGGLNDKSTISS
jgi:hypothetical protein